MFKPNKYCPHTCDVTDNIFQNIKLFYFSCYFTKSSNLSKLNVQVIPTLKFNVLPANISNCRRDCCF
ncbi:hypothetical protein LDENG_00059420 [Lucifuga dentata]|nr:hypothetical protein LDENG_00059420 [Lucifuga dentata]